MGGGQKLFGKSLLPLFKALRFPFSNGLISPEPPAEDGTPNCAFPTPILSATHALAHGGSSPRPGVLCLEPAGRTAEMHGAGE